jgi:hypothetical protein
MIDKYELFNKKLVEFVEDIIYICPEVNDFRVFKMTCDWAVNLDVKFAQNMFDVCVAKPYASQILSKDENFFLKESYDEYNDYIKKYNHDLNLIQKLKSIWKDLDDVNKENIWKYMQVLLILNNRCTQST